MLRGASFYWCILKGANFSEIVNYDDSSWKETAWWNAGKMDIKLIDYLEKNWPFKPSNKYADDQTHDDQTYKDAVSRLRAASVKE
jgi:hypothetical protein